MEYVLEMKDISKTFPGVKALDHVQLQVKPGEVHALMGENGAGKSTLMKILMGIYTKDNGGEIIFNGQPYHASNPKEAMDHGVAMIHQELNPILDMSVYENIFVGREIRKNGLVDAKAEIAEAEKLIKECGLHVSPKEKLRNLTVAQCQLIEIIKAISINAKVIIMDEPTAAITDRPGGVLFDNMTALDNLCTSLIPKAGQHIIRKKIVSSILSEALRWFPKEMLLQPLSSWSYPERLRFSYYRWYLLNPRLLICFFPFAGQESTHHKMIIDLLVLCAQRGMAVWIISSGIDAICEKTDNEEFLRRLHYLNK